MGAALALSPASVAADAVRKGQLPGELFDNLHEVLNVVANLFGGIHVRLQQVLPPSAALPASVAALVNRSSARLDLELAIAGYPGGRMSLVC
jgi:hypothetical protein